MIGIVLYSEGSQRLLSSTVSIPLVSNAMHKLVVVVVAVPAAVVVVMYLMMGQLSPGNSSSSGISYVSDDGSSVPRYTTAAVAAVLAMYLMMDHLSPGTQQQQ